MSARGQRRGFFGEEGRGRRNEKHRRFFFDRALSRRTLFFPLPPSSLSHRANSSLTSDDSAKPDVGSLAQADVSSDSGRGRDKRGRCRRRDGRGDGLDGAVAVDCSFSFFFWIRFLSGGVEKGQCSSEGGNGFEKKVELKRRDPGLEERGEGEIETSATAAAPSISLPFVLPISHAHSSRKTSPRPCSLKPRRSSAWPVSRSANPRRRSIVFLLFCLCNTSIASLSFFVTCFRFLALSFLLPPRPTNPKKKTKKEEALFTSEKKPENLLVL